VLVLVLEEGRWWRCGHTWRPCLRRRYHPHPLVPPCCLQAFRSSFFNTLFCFVLRSFWRLGGSGKRGESRRGLRAPSPTRSATGYCGTTATASPLHRWVRALLLVTETLSQTTEPASERHHVHKPSYPFSLTHASYLISRTPHHRCWRCWTRRCTSTTPPRSSPARPWAPWGRSPCPSPAPRWAAYLIPL